MTNAGEWLCIPGARGVPLGWGDNLSLVQLDHVDGDNDTMIQIYSPQFLGSTGIQVHQASLEKLDLLDYYLKRQ